MFGSPSLTQSAYRSTRQETTLSLNLNLCSVAINYFHFSFMGMRIDKLNALSENMLDMYQIFESVFWKGQAFLCDTKKSPPGCLW